MNSLIKLSGAFSLALSSSVVAAAQLGNLAADAAADYRARAQFPEWSQPVLDGIDPVAAARESSKQRMSGPNGAAPALETWTPQISYLAGERIDLHARLDWMDDSAAKLGKLRLSQLTGWAISGQLQSENLGVIEDVVYRDNGQGADQYANDGIYSARVDLAELGSPALGQAENIMVKLTASNNAGEVRKALGGFLLSNPAAYLTGNYKQVTRDGNLVVLAEADVLQSGRYHLSGTLDNVAGLALASAQSATELDAGKHWLELPFYGLIFHQLNSLSGLQLGQVALTTTNGMPNALGALQNAAYRLADINLQELTQTSFADADLLRAANNLDQLSAPAQQLLGGLNRLGGL